MNQVEAQLVGVPEPAEVVIEVGEDLPRRSSGYH